MSATPGEIRRSEAKRGETDRFVWLRLPGDSPPKRNRSEAGDFAESRLFNALAAL
jgi:hypothetical protein